MRTAFRRIFAKETCASAARGLAPHRLFVNVALFVDDLLYTAARKIGEKTEAKTGWTKESTAKKVAICGGVAGSALMATDLSNKNALMLVVLNTLVGVAAALSIPLYSVRSVRENRIAITMKDILEKKYDIIPDVFTAGSGFMRSASLIMGTFASICAVMTGDIAKYSFGITMLAATLAQYLVSASNGTLARFINFIKPPEDSINGVEKQDAGRETGNDQPNSGTGNWEQK